jgi:hypothetical protein
MTQKAMIYWIRLPDHKDINSEGYVGVTKDLEYRLKQHHKEIISGKHPNNHLMYAANKYGWDNLIKESVIVEEESKCYDIEKQLRPDKAIGWNIAPGGHRGPGWVKGRKHNPESVKKGRMTAEKNKREREERIKAGQPNEDDLIYLEKIRERELLEQHKQAEKLKEKARKKKLREEKRQEAKRQKQIEKNQNRTPGALIVEQQRRPLCAYCKITPAKPNGYSKLGYQRWQKYCTDCTHMVYNRRHGYLKNKKTQCENCEFIPEDTCQLDLLYIDGKQRNKKPENMLTLCANCSRLWVKRRNQAKKNVLDITVDSDIGI